MWGPDRIIATLTARGELWQPMPGVVGLRGDTLALFTALERAIGGIARSETCDEWRVPQAIPPEVLARADYFASFPQWLTLASHLVDDEAVLSRVAADEFPASAARRAAAPAEAALPPAVCYHAYAALAGRVVESRTILTAQGTCWRHEGARHAALERGWAFTMREIVCLGSPAETAAFRARVAPCVTTFAAALGLNPTVVEATDPFFMPTARGKALLQRVKALKHELLLPLGDGRSIAAASFNQHEGFFGEAFNIRLDGGEVASTACVAFGIERWLLAVLAAHGPESRNWPAIDDSLVADGAA